MADLEVQITLNIRTNFESLGSLLKDIQEKVNSIEYLDIKYAENPIRTIYRETPPTIPWNPKPNGVEITCLSNGETNNV